MDGREIVYGALIGAVIGVILGIYLRKRVKQKTQAGGQEAAKLQRRLRPIRIISTIVLTLMTYFVTTLIINKPWNATIEKTFTKAGLSITLTAGFTEKEMMSKTAYYESKSAIVTVLKEEFSLFESVNISTDISLREYAQLVITQNMLEAEPEEREEPKTVEIFEPVEKEKQ